jgi:addiction module HigA family antidote
MTKISMSFMDTRLSPIHPGEVLLEDFMKPLGISQYRLAKDIGVSPIRISQIIRGERSITVDTAMRLGRYFGTARLSGCACKFAMTWNRRRPS